MLAHSIFFYTFSFIAIISAIMVTVSKNTVHSVFFLILDFISISCLFIMIGAEFLGMIMLIVYVGAVAVLFLFVVLVLFCERIVVPPGRFVSTVDEHFSLQFQTYCNMFDYIRQSILHH